MNVNKSSVCLKGLIFPTPLEKDWSIPLRACLYLIALLYSFMGTAYIADVFMSAIERITSRTKKVLVTKGKKDSKSDVYKEVLVWNPTVANVSLMALGTSAPEIMISVIEVLGHNFKAGELGPGVIVGSAAFNLMVITAICIAAVPKGDKKTISKISVYCVTAFWNIFAYLWLLFILMGPSKDQVEVWEGALTFLFFFAFILSAYATDKQMYKWFYLKIFNVSFETGMVVNDSHVPPHKKISDIVAPEFHEIEVETSWNPSDETKVVHLKNKSHHLKDELDTINGSISLKDLSSNKIDIEAPTILRTLQIENQPWLAQFRHYLLVKDRNSKTSNLITDYALHIVSLPWKLICALVPPPAYLHGWPAFIIALALISAVTTFVLDIANTFGCLVGLNNTITAITFVAVGSSLPDTFASRIAAIQDKTADNAVGNVTGSNSVNVFIGLGFPWLVASIYWAAQGKPFHVPSGDIGFCVTIYCMCAIVTLSLLFARRFLDVFGKAELGGPTSIKWICAILLIFVWLLYVLLSSLQVSGQINVHF